MIYGWSGSHPCTHKAARTDDLVGRYNAELKCHPDGPKLFTGDVNADPEVLPALMQILNEDLDEKVEILYMLERMLDYGEANLVRELAKRSIPMQSTAEITSLPTDKPFSPFDNSESTGMLTTPCMRNLASS